MTLFFPASDWTQPRSILVIEAPQSLRMFESFVPRPLTLVIRHRQLSSEMIRLCAPDCITMPLMRNGFCVMDTAERLDEIGYGGRVYVFGPDIPDREMVEAELRETAPGLDLHLICEG